MFQLLDAATTATESAGTAQPGGFMNSGWMILIYVALFGIIIYFLMIRPERKRRKEETKMRDSIQIGDEIVTIGGLYGRIVSVKDDSYVIETVDHSKIRISKTAIQTNLTVHES